MLSECSDEPVPRTGSSRILRRSLLVATAVSWGAKAPTADIPWSSARRLTTYSTTAQHRTWHAHGSTRAVSKSKSIGETAWVVLTKATTRGALPMDSPQYRDLRAALADVPDPRRRRGRRYCWPVLLTLIAAALVSGQQGMRAIGQWVAEHSEELGPLVGLVPGRVPSAATLRRTVRAVDLAALEAQIG